MSSDTRKILLLGAGFVARPCVEFLVRRAENQLTVAARHLDRAEKLRCSFQDARVRERILTASLDVANVDALDQIVAKHDLVISLVPYIHHAIVLAAAIKHKKQMVTTSYISPAMTELNDAAAKAGIVCLNEIGLDPGVDHLWALKTIWAVQDAGGSIDHFTSYCGGLPAPECSNNPLGYKFSWSSRGVLLALRNNAKYIENAQHVTVNGPQLLRSAKPIWTGYPAFAFVGYANRDSTPYDRRYNIPEAKTILRGTLRYQGFPEIMQAMTDMNLLDDQPLDCLDANAPQISWRKYLASKVQVSETATDEELEAAVIIKAKLGDAPATSIKPIIAGLQWFGMFRDDVQVPQRGTPLDALCATFEAKMQYAPGERDMVFLQHRFDVTLPGKNSKPQRQTITATLVEYGTEDSTAMARTVGVPCGVAAQMILDGKIKQSGVLAPMSREIVLPLIEALQAEHITLQEEFF